MKCDKIVPFKLAETWFWMAYSSKETALNLMGIKKIEQHFGCVKNAINKYPELSRFTI